MIKNYDVNTNKWYPKKVRRKTEHGIDSFTDRWYHCLATRNWSTNWPKRDHNSLLQQIQEIPKGIQTGSELLDMISYCIFRAQTPLDLYLTLYDDKDVREIWENACGVNYRDFKIYLDGALQVIKIVVLGKRNDFHPSVKFTQRKKYQIPRDVLRQRGLVFKAYMQKNANNFLKDSFPLASFQGMLLPFKYPDRLDYPDAHETLEAWLKAVWFHSKQKQFDDLPNERDLLNITYSKRK